MSLITESIKAFRRMLKASLSGNDDEYQQAKEEYDRIIKQIESPDEPTEQKKAKADTCVVGAVISVLFADPDQLKEKSEQGVRNHRRRMLLQLHLN